MDRNSRVTRAFAAAAMTGLVAGAATLSSGCKTQNADNNAGMSPTTTSATGDTAQLAKHECKGMNACKGQGGCNTGDNGCKGKNSCKGKGGCATNK
jgi:hypothetical protein